MTTWIRLFRSPATAIAWLLVLTIMAGLLGVGGTLLHATNAMEDTLSSQHTTIAIRGGVTTNEEGEEVYPRPLLAEPTVKHTDPNMPPAEAALMDYALLEQLEKLPSVELIDMRTLTGAYIPELTSLLGLRNWANVRTGERYHQIDIDIHDKTTNMSYNEVILVGTIESVSSGIVDPNFYYDLSAAGLGVLQATGVYARMNVEQALSIHPDYTLFASEDYSEYCGKVWLDLSLKAEQEDPFFEVGKTYIVTGMYDPSCHGRSTNYISTDGEYGLPWVELNNRQHTSSSSIVIREGEQVVAYRQGESDYERSIPDETGNMINRETFTTITDPMVIAQEIPGNLEDFLEKNPHWQQWITETQQVQHAFPVLGTECLETMQCFLTNAATVTEGRTFTREEYDTGAKVLMLSEELAQTGDIHAGDTITLNQFLCDTGEWSNRSLSWCGIPQENLNEPDVGFFPLKNGMEAEETFTVVGIYRLERAWEDTAYSITPNTIFMPQKTQLPGGYGGCDELEYLTFMTYALDGNNQVIYEDGKPKEVEMYLPDPHYRGSHGIFLSVKIKNGQLENFRKELEEAGLTSLNFVTLDTGYDGAVLAVHEAQAQSEKLFGILALSWVVLLMLYLLLFQSRQQKNLGIMRSLGATGKQTRGYLFGSGMVLALVGVVLGTALSGTFARLFGEQIYQYLFQNDAALSHSGGQAMTDTLAGNILDLAALPVGKLLLLIGLQLGIMALLMGLQSWLLSRKKPRQLMGKG
ncbi:MAG: ABC transporter permease [Ruminococcaceae bacterium]|nr:ABC transporter permease [Oscillospiraceae bacterium]